MISLPMNPVREKSEASRLKALRRYRIMDTQAEQAFDDFTNVAAFICETPIAIIALIDEKRQWFKSKVGITNSETPREQAFCAHTILQEKVMVVEDATRDVRFSANPLVTSEPNIRFYAGAPLLDGAGNALGSLCVIDRKPRALSPGQEAALAALSRQVVSQMELRLVSEQLAEALVETKMLRSLLPICSHCKAIRDETGNWHSIERYLSERVASDTSHGICTRCMHKHYPDIFGEICAEAAV